MVQASPKNRLAAFLANMSLFLGSQKRQIKETASRASKKIKEYLAIFGKNGGKLRANKCLGVKKATKISLSALNMFIYIIPPRPSPGAGSFRLKNQAKMMGAGVYGFVLGKSGRSGHLFNFGQIYPFVNQRANDRVPWQPVHNQQKAARPY